MNRGFATAAALLAVVGLAGCGSGTDKETSTKKPIENLTVTGSVTVWSPDISAKGHAEDSVCSTNGAGGYGDVVAKAPILVRNASGTKVGLGTLGAGALKAGPGGLAVCEFQFAVTGVQDKGDIFTLQVGSQPEFNFKRAAAADLKLTYK